MSMFWIGGPERIVPKEELKEEMEQDAIFLPGIIHGGDDYLIDVFLNENESFDVYYFTKDLILEAYDHDPSCEDDFWQYLICNCECFGCDNDGSGDFASLVEEWPNTVIMSNSELVAWAKGVSQYNLFDNGDILVFYPSDKLFVRASVGTGDNLLKEDRDEGYVDYLDLEAYKAGLDCGDPVFNEHDGGMLMTKKPICALGSSEIINEIGEQFDVKNTKEYIML